MHDAHTQNAVWSDVSKLKHIEIQRVFSRFNPITNSTKCPEGFERNLLCTNLKIASYWMWGKGHNWSDLKASHPASAKNSLIWLSSYSANHLIVCPQTLMNLCCLLYQLDEKLQAHSHIHWSIELLSGVVLCNAITGLIYTSFSNLTSPWEPFNLDPYAISCTSFRFWIKMQCMFFFSR